jgi:cellobiose phosphorylase
VHYRFRETVYHIKVMQKQAGEKEAITVTVDGVVQPGKAITFVDDGQEHAVEVEV